MNSNAPAEIELKLRLHPGADAALRQSPCFDDVPTERRHETTRYFDTPGLTLQANGFALRIRSGSSGFVQTLKTAPTNGGAASHRGEWEWQVSQPEPALDLLDGTPAARLVGEVAAALDAVCITDIERVVRRLHFADGTEIETAHDRGTIVAGNAREPVDELELELRSGSLAALYQLAIRLLETVPMHLAPESKSARGYRLRAGRPAEAFHAPKLLLPPKIRANAALRDIAGAHLGAVLANIAAAEGENAEGIHQLRVGLRRLRSVLVMFAPMLERHVGDLFATELRRLGQVFGARRDHDVFWLETLPALAQDGGTDWSDLLRTRAQEARADALPPVMETLHGASFTGLALGLAAWFEAGMTQPDMLGAGPWTRRLDAVAPDLLDRLARKVARRATRIDGSEGLHDLRKALKKLRYATEFVAGLYDGDAVKTYRKRCATLQDRLGAINDARVAQTLAAALAAGDQLRLAPAVAALAAQSARRGSAAMDGLEEALSDFLDAAPFWR